VRVKDTAEALLVRTQTIGAPKGPPDYQGVELAADRRGKVVQAQGYQDLHPTHFNWTRPVRRAVNRYQAMFPYLTYANSYLWHPPYDPPAITRRYDALSVDFWGGGLDSQGRYTGYRGKPLPDALHERLFDVIFNDPKPPYIDWILSNGWMWSYRSGWSVYDPYDPYDADMGHRRHLHITFRP
jgi:hypothetical protein